MSEIDSIVLNGTEYMLAGGGGTPATMYTITNNLTNVTNSNGATSIREGRAYTATLALTQDATLDSVVVTMGGTDITATTWDATTMTVSIASVTNNVVITAKASVVITQAITWTGNTDMTSQIIDATSGDVYYEVAYNDGDSRFVSGVTSESAFSKVRDAALYSDPEGTNLVGYYRRDSGQIAESRRTAYNTPAFYYNTKVLIAPAGYYIQMMVTRSNPSFGSNDNFSSYVNEYGATLILETPEPEPETISNAEAVDRDLMQMYSLKAVSLNTDTIADATSYEGIIEEAKNAWMKEYGGSIDKIPLIIHTDQHSSMTPANSSAMWEAIDNMVSWYDISKVINLGDTTNSYENFDDPTLGDSSLESYLEATKAVPFSKRIEVFGNHDCMQIRGGALTYIPQYPSYLNPYFKNVMARRTSNNGYHVTYDPYFNVKYVVYSRYDYVDATHYSIVSSAQYDFLIEEMSKNDGYDIILCAHTRADVYQEYLGSLVQARYNKTSGTFTDSEGATHTYDFSGCENDLLVVLHGHSHADWSHYDLDVLQNCFLNYYESTRPIYFVLVDKANERLRLWKVLKTPKYYVYSVPFKPLESISAIYTQSGTVQSTDSLSDLISDLVVTANWVDTTTSEVDSSEYALIGTLTTGTSTITVNYGNKTTTFDVTVA